jgi:hypothetical membrane protein
VSNPATDRTASPRRAAHLAGAIAWILALQWLVGQFIVQAAWTTPYSLATNYVSDLGAVRCGRSDIFPPRYVCSPLHDVMNVSFVLYGLLIVVGVVLLRDTWPRRRLAIAGLVLLALCGLGKVVVGFAPGDVQPGLHMLGALGIPFGDLGILLLGLAIWKTARGWALFSAFLGALGLVSVVLLVANPQLGVGTVERLADYPPPVWLAAMGTTIVAGRGRLTLR